ncbi:MAG: Na+/H+ antiporter subunit E [Proteobacteria bacterium]|nr:Na+/H+ antiporter subunit E [Pseudomonadota bacterium]MBU1386595.1 Na+/H+ antiporter subunit E [Pseudomonadota bacterium]MBU1542496.1 Na+/H+ antiporter subunit E [Pseudomonadota bacterium]MBU2481526.1 Na+/H+ antiporter subunit E [Pseudomonadota bacterium]
MTVSTRSPGQNSCKQTSGYLKSFFPFLITFFIMFLSWIVLSGKFEPLLLWLGGISSFFVSYYFYDLIFPDFKLKYFTVFFRFVRYIPWILFEILKANFHLLYIAFHPRLKEIIDPQIVIFKTNLKSDIAITTLANSITLTPGTITVSANSDGVFKVHALDRQTAEALPGVMLEKVAKIFGEKI